MYSFRWQSLGTSTGALPSRGLVFPLVCCFHRYWAYSSKSTVQSKIESCFQDKACFFFPSETPRVAFNSVRCISACPWIIHQHHHLLAPTSLLYLPTCSSSGHNQNMWWYFCPISHPRLIGLGTVGSGLLYTLARSQITSSFSSIGVMLKSILFKMLF